MFYLLVSYGVVENLNHGITTTLRPQNGKRIRDAALLASFSSITFAAKKQKSQNNDSSRTI